MEYKNQTENRAFQEMFQAAVKRLNTLHDAQNLC